MIQFEYTGYLYIFLALPFWWMLVNVWRIKEWQRKMRWNQLLIPDHDDQPGIFDRPDRNTSFFLLGMACVIIALANPRWGYEEETVKAERSDIYIALDISHSMNARDVAPSRLEKAKKWVSDFIMTQRNNRLGIIFFAGNAYLQMPLSLDFSSGLMYVQSISTAMAPTQGSSMGEAITLAKNQQKEGDNTQKALIIISDGEDHEGEAQKAAGEAASDGFVIYTVGVGTEEGSEVPMITDEGIDLALEEDGTPAVSRLNRDVLNAVAEAGNGTSYLLDRDGDIIRDIQKQLEGLQKQLSEQKTFTASVSYFWLFILMALVCFIIPYFPLKLKKAAVLIPVILSGITYPVYAQSAHDFLSDGDRLYLEKRFPEAEKQYLEAGREKPSFRSDYNRGNALFEQQRFAEAAEAYAKAIEKNASPASKAMAYHNLGNARFRQQQYGQSVDAYKKALQYNPGDQETIENLLKARKLWRQQQKEEEKQKKQQEEKKQQDQKPSPEENQPDNTGQNPSPSQQGKSDASKKQDKPNGTLSEEEAEKLLDIIGNEDKKVHRKIRRGGQPKKEPGKPW